MRRTLLVTAATVALSGCFRVQVETGAPTSSEVYQDTWAGSFFFGLVGPNPYFLADRCPNGVSKLEVHHSFPNVLASLVTIGIYTPASIAVRCASGPVHVPTADEMRRREMERGRGGEPGGRGGRGGRGRGPTEQLKAPTH